MGEDESPVPGPFEPLTGPPRENVGRGAKDMFRNDDGTHGATRRGDRGPGITTTRESDLRGDEGRLR